MDIFKVSQKILFQHCDTAGIVFYPRFFEMVNATVERWFEDELGYSFARMHLELHTGIPTAHIDIDFKNPSHLGEEIYISIIPHDVGNSSINCSFKAQGLVKADLRFQGNVTLVYFDVKSGRPISIPDDMRSELNRFIQPLSKE